MLSKIEKTIHQYNEKVRKKSHKPEVKSCPRCSGVEQYFQRHELRERKYLVRIENIVKRIIGFLVRWRCMECEKTFTDYPDFCVRNKQYIKDSIEDKCQEYVNKSETSYEKLAMLVGYMNKGKEEERMMAKSTIWRWCGDLGKRKELCECVVKLLTQVQPQLKIYKKFYPIAKWKYKSEERRECLLTLQKLGAVVQELSKAIKKEIFFTHFETW